MRKRRIVLITAALLLGLIGLEVKKNADERNEYLNNPLPITAITAGDQNEYPAASEYASIAPGQESYPEDAEEFVFYITNASAEPLYYWPEFEYREDGLWYNVPYRPTWPPTETPLAQLDLPAGETVRHGIRTGGYVELPAGTYRLALAVYDGDTGTELISSLNYIFDVTG